MILILGGKGFIGSALARACQVQKREYAVITRESYPDYIGKDCEVLVNASGNSKKYLAHRSPLEEFDASVKSVRSSLVDFRFDHYVHISSGDVYADCSSPALTAEATPLDPEHQSAYGFHKYLAELCVRHAARRWLIFRFGGLVGPGLKKNAIYDILQGGPLWLDPQSELQYLDVDRGAGIVLDLIDRDLAGEVFNIGGQGVIKLQDLISLRGAPVSVVPNSPRVRYEVNICKLAALTLLPNTRDCVFEFARSYATSQRGDQ